MNIDLLVSDQGEVGLVSDKGFGHALAGVMYDTQTGQLTLEFADADSFDMNIPVQGDGGDSLLHAHTIHVGIVERGVISDSRQVPLVLQEDPFGGGNFGSFPVKPRSSVMAFEAFMKRAASGQPVHRDNLAADLDTTGSVIGSGGISAASLALAPHLSRQRALEAAPATPAPKGPSGPSGPGGMGGGGRTVIPPRPQQPRQVQSDDDE